MKMCGRVNANPSLALNQNFALLVSKCKGVTPARDNTRPIDSKSLWDDMKDEYKKDNPDIKLMGDKFITNRKKLIEGKSFLITIIKDKQNQENRFRRISVRKIVSLEDIVKLSYNNVFIEIDNKENLKKLYDNIKEKGNSKIKISSKNMVP